MGQIATAPCRERVLLPPNLTARDLAVFLHIQKNGFTNYAEIKNLFWGAKDPSNFYRRIRKLKRAKWLDLIKGDGDTVLGIRLTKKSFDWLAKNGLLKSPVSPNAFRYRTNFEHDRIANRVRQVLEQSPVISQYQGEAEVRKILAEEFGTQEERERGYKVPDALFRLRNAHGKLLKVALEVELTVKSKKRYRALARRMAEARSFDALFYIVANEHILWRLRNIWKDVIKEDAFVQVWNHEHAMYFASLEELEEKGLAATFFGESGNFSLASLVPKNEVPN